MLAQLEEMEFLPLEEEKWEDDEFRNGVDLTEVDADEAPTNKAHDGNRVHANHIQSAGNGNEVKEEEASVALLPDGAVRKTGYFSTKVVNWSRDTYILHHG